MKYLKFLVWFFKEWLKVFNIIWPTISDFISKVLIKFEQLICKPSGVAVRLAFFVDGREINQMQLKVSQKVVLHLKPVDKFGNVARVDGAPAWSTTDPALGALSVAEDGLSAEFVPAGSLGSLQVQASADADLGEGVKAIAGNLDVDLLPGDAVSLELSADAPVDV